MRVLVISFFNSWITHFATELEIAQRHLDDGDTVEFLGCDGCITICDGNRSACQSQCELCREKRHNGLGQLRPIPVQHRLGLYVSKEILSGEAQALSSIGDAESAKSFRYHGHDLGWGALSSAVMTDRDPDCDSPDSIAMLKSFAKAAYRSYHGVLAFLQSQPQYDRVYIFNGRFAPTRGALRACQEFGNCDIQIHERGSTIDRYQLFGNSLPHNRALWEQRIEEFWTSAGDRTAREEAGCRFYALRRAGKASDWKSFVSSQVAGRLPECWNDEKINIAIFNSSEFEFAGIGDEWKNPVYEKQTLGIERIVSESLERYPNMHFYLRMHPNLIGVENRDVSCLLNLRASNFTLITPDADISTYALMEAADKILSFGSTMGIEATYWGKVSISVGRSFYEQLDAVYIGRDHDHVMSLLDADLRPRNRENALKYGSYMMTFGRPFKYWEPDSFEWGKFRGFEIGQFHMNRWERRVFLRLQDYGLNPHAFLKAFSYLRGGKRGTVRMLDKVRSGLARICSCLGVGT